MDWLLRIVYEESLVSDIGRACLMEVGYKSRWWARCNHVCDKFGLWELVNLLWLKNINKEGMAMVFNSLPKFIRCTTSCSVYGFKHTLDSYLMKALSDHPCVPGFNNSLGRWRLYQMEDTL